MTAATLFSGIGAPEVAMPHWHWLWHAEIEKFPSAVMAARHADSINLGDVAADDFCERALAIGRPDVLVFGSPCQSFSVAGRRLGLDDPRGNLALIALGIAARLEPTWFVFENVPGLLSASEGRDFGLFLRTVDELGYHLCWSHLDAQYRGLAQRRNRLFAVGHARDWRYPAAVLLEPSRLCGHPPSRQEARQDVAGTIRSGSGGEAAQGMLIGTLTGNDGPEGFETARLVPTAFGRNNQSGPIDVATARSSSSSPHGRLDFESETFIVAHSLRAEGFDASEDGTGRGTPLVAVAYAIGSHAGTAEGDQTNRSHASGGPVGLNISEESAYALRGGRTQAIAFTAKDYGADAESELSPTLRSGGHDQSHANGGVMPAVAFDWQSGGSKQRTRTRTRTSALSANQTPAVFTPTAVQEAQTGVREYDTAGSLRANGPGHDPVGTRIRESSGVRRLTSRECERLQGFPDDYTLITYRGKPSADGPRYKAIGNSMAVPVVRWILSRIEWMQNWQGVA